MIEAYKCWVRENAGVVGAIESALSLATWVLPDSGDPDSFKSEAVRSAVGLVSVVHEAILTQRDPSTAPASGNLSLCLAALQQLEVLVEVGGIALEGSGKGRVGAYGKVSKYDALATLEAVKAALRLALLHRGGGRLLLAGGVADPPTSGSADLARRERAKQLDEAFERFRKRHGLIALQPPPGRAAGGNGGNTSAGRRGGGNSAAPGPSALRRARDANEAAAGVEGGSGSSDADAAACTAAAAAAAAAGNAAAAGGTGADRPSSASSMPDASERGGDGGRGNTGSMLPAASPTAATTAAARGRPNRISKRVSWEDEEGSAAAATAATAAAAAAAEGCIGGSTGAAENAVPNGARPVRTSSWRSPPSSPRTPAAAAAGAMAPASASAGTMAFVMATATAPNPPPAAPPPPQLPAALRCGTHVLVAGEALHVLRPLAYVLALRRWGPRSWRPWLLSLSLELSSLWLTNQGGRLDAAARYAEALPPGTLARLLAQAQGAASAAAAAAAGKAGSGCGGSSGGAASSSSASAKDGSGSGGGGGQQPLSGQLTPQLLAALRGRCWQPDERAELLRRRALLLYYLLRSPFFETATRRAIRRIQGGLSYVPIVRGLADRAVEILEQGVQPWFTYTSGS